MKNITMRDAFFSRLYELAKKDRKIIVISADMGAPGLDKYRRDLGKQFVNVGIAEANMVTIATGLALSGKKVFIYAIMSFVTSRCYEMIKVDLSLMNIPVTVIGVGAGFSYDDSGPTHHCTEDIAIMRALPNMALLSPSDSIMAAKFADLACRLSSPSYIRLDREILPLINNQRDSLIAGINNLRSGKDICIIATGNMVHKALEVSDVLARYSISAGVIDVYRLKPINRLLLMKYFKQTQRILTLEEHLMNGGLGSIIAETLVDNNYRVPLKRIAVPDRYYYAYGGRNNIQALCGLDTKSVIKVILGWIE